MKIIIDLLSNRILLAAVVGWCAAQILKTIIHMIRTRSWDFRRLVGSGGMPSAHSTAVTALTISVGRYDGIKSPLFAAVALFSVLAIHDSVVVRYESGEHARFLNQLLGRSGRRYRSRADKSAPKIAKEDRPLKELLGHTLRQVAAGIAIGILIGAFFPWF